MSQARKYRQDKLKQAKVDAAAEINAYRQMKDQDLKEFENKNAGGVDKLEKEGEISVQKELEDIKKIAASKEKDVVKLLVEAVTKPVAEMHINAI